MTDRLDVRSVRSVPRDLVVDPSSPRERQVIHVRFTVASDDGIVNVLRDPLRAIGAGCGDFRSQRPKRGRRNPMKREGRNLASAVMALVHLDHESHSTFRSGSCQAGRFGVWMRCG